MQGVYAFDPKATVSIDLESFVAEEQQREGSKPQLNWKVELLSF
jgi:hypothetical protein